MSANPIIEVMGSAANDWKTAFGTLENATTAKAGDYIQVTGIPPYDGTWRVTKVWRAGAGNPPKMFYAVGEDLHARLGAPEGWPAHNHAPVHNVSALTVMGASANNAVSGPQRIHIPTGALIEWSISTAGKAPQTVRIEDANGTVVATATGASPDGSLHHVASGQLRAKNGPFYTVIFDIAARILPGTSVILHDRKIFLTTHQLMTDRTAQDAGYRDMMVEIRVFENMV